MSFEIHCNIQWNGKRKMREKILQSDSDLDLKQLYEVYEVGHAQQHFNRICVSTNGLKPVVQLMDLNTSCKQVYCT